MACVGRALRNMTPRNTPTGEGNPQNFKNLLYDFAMRVAADYTQFNLICDVIKSETAIDIARVRLECALDAFYLTYTAYYGKTGYSATFVENAQDAVNNANRIGMAMGRVGVSK